MLAVQKMPAFSIAYCFYVTVNIIFVERLKIILVHVVTDLLTLSYLTTALISDYFENIT